MEKNKEEKGGNREYPDGELLDDQEGEDLTMEVTFERLESESVKRCI